ncbi:outer membrane protein assembly factor BamB [Thiohalocapsa marina]|uniref:Outer membrane protein assembly factor BamB n=2 Tax=Thiohalocapsa marina TaxID=424902 RepID=A0A5M8FEJ8_9GAMM|nr:outer membrane protein assembly factor BamB [Thiohalocapsa marina]KAA6183308.1 outer membrane protein assembly factor BamB [Thiohalocapsa marina]
MLLAALLSGCSAVPWIGGEKDPTPPTPIDKKLTQEVSPRVLWKTRIGKGTRERQLRLIPVLADGKLFAADPAGRVVAVSPADGRVLWEYKTERKARIPFSGGPAVADGTLVVGSSNGDLLALSSRDGTLKWRIRLGSEILAVPLIVNDLVVVHTIDDSVYGIALADGSERWRYDYPAPVLTLRGSSTPAEADGGVIVGLAGGRLLYLELEQGMPVWELTITPPRGRSELDRIADIDADPVVVGNIAYVATYNGDLAAVDIAAGMILWRRELSAHAGLTADGSALYVTDSEDNLWAAEPTDGAGLWRQEGLLHRRLTAPALSGNALVVGDIDGYLHLVSRRDGRMLGYTRVAKDRIGHRPVVANGIVYIYANDGTLAAVRINAAAGDQAGDQAPAAAAASATQD